MALVASTLLDLVKNLRAFAGILVVSALSIYKTHYFTGIWGLNSQSDCVKNWKQKNIVFYPRNTHKGEQQHGKQIDLLAQSIFCGSGPYGFFHKTSLLYCFISPHLDL